MSGEAAGGSCALVRTRTHSERGGDSGEAPAAQVESAEPYLRKCVNQAGGRNLLRLIAGRRLAAGAAIRDRGSKGPHMDG